MKFHDAANIFPLMDGPDTERLSEDIAAHGLHDAIETLDGKILDGRNRFRACELKGVAPRFVEAKLNGSTPCQYVWSKNGPRRHLSETQRAIVGAKMKEQLAIESKERQKRRAADSVPANLPEQKGDSRDKAAELVNVSGKTIDAASKVLKSGSPELIAAVERNEIAVSKAAKIAELPKAQQRAVVKDGGDMPAPRKPKPKPVAEDAAIEELVGDIEALDERLATLSKSSSGEVKKKLRFAVKLLREAIDLIREK